MSNVTDPNKRDKSRTRLLNALTLLLLGLTILMILCYGTIFILPTVPFNPFPPYSQAILTIVPAPTPTTAGCAPPHDWQIYVPQAGDTLFSIARRSGLTVEELSLANCLSGPNLLGPDTLIFVPRLPLTPTPTKIPDLPNVIAMVNVSTQTDGQGNQKMVAELKLDPLGLGQLDLTYPSKITLGDTGFVLLNIAPDVELATLPSVTVNAPVLSASPPVTDTALKYSERLLVYPYMQAELTGSDFDIIADGQPQRYVLSQGGAGWAWTVRPHSLGRHALLLQIGIPVALDQAQQIIGVQALKNIPIEVQVVSPPIPATPTATPTLMPTVTPTPLPAMSRISEKLIENSPIIVVAIIGLIGTLVTVYANSRAKDRDRKIADLEKLLAQGTTENESLRKEVTRLKSIRRWQFWRR